MSSVSFVSCVVLFYYFYFYIVMMIEKKKELCRRKCTTRFLHCLKRKDSTRKPLKIETAKNLLSNRYLIGTTWVQCMSFTVCDNRKTLFSIKVYRCFEIFLTVMLLLSLKKVF